MIAAVLLAVATALALVVAIWVLVWGVPVLWSLRHLRYRRPRYRVRSIVFHSEYTNESWRNWNVWSMDDDDLRPKITYRYLTFRAAVSAAHRLSRDSPRRWEIKR